jgi:hypothetical protein
MNYHDFEPKDFENEIIRKIPLHIQKYMEGNNIFAYDLDAKEYENKRATQHKIQQTLVEERSASVYEDEIMRRDSAVDIKAFVQDTREAAY